MQSATRRGFTLVELLIALLLLALVGGVMYRVLNSVQRSSRTQGEVAAMQGTLRSGLLVAMAELQEVAADQPSGTSDLLSMTGTAVTYQGMRGLGAVCLATLGSVTIPTAGWGGLRIPTGGRDALFIFADGDESSATDDAWLDVPFTALAAGACPDGSAAWVLTVALNAAQVLSIVSPAPVRTYETMELAQMTQDGRTWLGLRSVSAGQVLQPIAGPLEGTGVTLSYRDANDAVTATAANVKSILITLRGETDRPVNAGPGLTPMLDTDTVTVRVQLRNAR